MRRQPPTIVVAGAGFSGVSVAAHLARLPWRSGVRIVLLERSDAPARGVAYSTPSRLHLLNVPAGRMGAFADDEGHFLRWLRLSEPSLSGDAFVPRLRYGEYLASILHDLQTGAPAGVQVEVRHADARDIETAGPRLRVHVASSAPLDADCVVLATGTPAPSRSEIGDALRDDPRYVHDPWANGALGRVRSSQPILLVGTGLTMVDAVLALRESGHGAGFLAVSRRGLLPQPHRDWPLPPPVVQPPAGLSAWNGSASALLAMIHDSVRHATLGGLDWRDVINGLRPLTPSLWRRMPTRERERFLRHVRPFWDTHRHRMSTRVAAEVNAMIFRGELSVLAGRIESCHAGAGSVEVGIRRRGQPITTPHRAGAVINCTGPASDYARVDEPLFAALRGRGLATPDPLRLGIATDDQGALIDARGAASPVLFTLGNPRKADLWESTAVPELRSQAARLAARLQESLETG
jgi:uncharacterized NAD(P)/FAD-binding protein YdhS